MGWSELTKLNKQKQICFYGCMLTTSVVSMVNMVLLVGFANQITHVGRPSSGTILVLLGMWRNESHLETQPEMDKIVL